MLTIRPSVIQDADHVADHMRPEDAMEVKASSGRTPIETLLVGLNFSDVCLTVHADEPVAMLGVGPGPSKEVGAVWMLATTALERHATAFLRASRKSAVLDNLHRRYPILWNHVDERNTKHVQWLKWLGFTFIMRHPFHGVEQRPFLEFVRINQSCATQ